MTNNGIPFLKITKVTRVSLDIEELVVIFGNKNVSSVIELDDSIKGLDMSTGH
jgi:hypothetical protein